jgi:hypothetical protein
MGERSFRLAAPAARMGPEFALALARSRPRGQGYRRQERLRMSLGQPNRRNEPLYVVPMALALVLAAFLGAAAGLVWQSVATGSAEETEVPAKDG